MRSHNEEQDGKEIALDGEQEWNLLRGRMTEQRVRRSKRINSNRRRIEKDWVRGRW